MTKDKKNSALRSPWVYAWIGLVVVVLAVNITMIMFSKDKNPGLVNDDFYERGQDYEQNMAERLKKNLQWKYQYEVSKPLVLNKPGTISITVKDTKGDMAKIDNMVLFIYRPANAELDFKQEMTKVSDGQWTAQVSFPAKGVWDLLAAANIGDDEFNFAKRVFINEK